MLRIFAVLIGMFHAANGFYMITAPEKWFATVPSVSATGPFNSHFVMDVGFAFLAGGAAFLAFAWRPKLKLMALGASGFLMLHALFHLSNLIHGHLAHAATDIGIAVPVALGLAICWPRKGEL